jgi:hypothetical protein
MVKELRPVTAKKKELRPEINRVFTGILEASTNEFGPCCPLDQNNRHAAKQKYPQKNKRVSVYTMNSSGGFRSSFSLSVVS